MKAFPYASWGLWIAVVLALTAVGPAQESAADEASADKSTAITYEVALINKSMTGEWQDERAFRKQVQALFGTTKILKFKLRGDPLQDWLDTDSPSVAKVICLIDGWVSPGMKRVDVRGFKHGTPLKETLEVNGVDWLDALVRAKRYVESSE